MAAVDGSGSAANPIHVKVDRGPGCCGGCVTTFVVLAVIGLVAGFVSDHWPVLVVVTLVAVVVGGIGWALREHAASEDGDGRDGSTVACAACGAAVAGVFCGACGTDQRTCCRGCGQVGVQTPFCPQCGSAVGGERGA